MPESELLAVVAIPVYNHASTLRAVVQAAFATLRTLPPDLPSAHPHVLVVDDGSDDNPAAALAGLDGVELRRHERNRGKGAAIRTAAQAARDMGATHLVTLDADGQHDPSDLPRFLAVLKDSPLAIVIGKRDMSSPDVPRISRFGRWFSNFWVRVHTGQAVGDSQSGFRAYPLALLEGLPLRESRYAFEVEVLVKSAWAGARLRDVDILVHYAPRGRRISHFRAWGDNVRIAWLNTRLTLRCLLPWPQARLIARETPDRITAIHPLRSIRQLLRNGVAPADLAWSAALGVGIGAFPLLGIQTVTVLAVAGYLGRNRLAALAANQLCTPPLVPALCVEIGFFLRHGHFLTELSLDTLGRQALDRLWEWLLGAFLAGPFLAGLIAAIVYALSLTLNAQLRAMRHVADKWKRPR